MNKYKGDQTFGRPRKEIDTDTFEKLCNLQCTLIEIAGFFKCCEDTIENWCKKTYNLTFSDAFKRFSQEGKMSLRRTQFRLAEKSPAMAIFLGKQYLGQTEKIDTNINSDENYNLMKEYMDEIKYGK